MTDELEVEISAAAVPDDPTDGVVDDDPPLEIVPVDGTPEDGVAAALFADPTDPTG